MAGIYGICSADNDVSSNRPHRRQAALDYLKREVPFAAEIGAGYLLVVPGAVGRPGADDVAEFDRSVETLCLAADLFVRHRVKAAVEPIRVAEVSICHTVADAIRYIEAVGHPGVCHINGDVYHMQAEEEHIGEAILADSNRRALGRGSLDLDTII